MSLPSPYTSHAKDIVIVPEGKTQPSENKTTAEDLTSLDEWADVLNRRCLFFGK